MCWSGDAVDAVEAGDVTGDVGEVGAALGAVEAAVADVVEEGATGPVLTSPVGGTGDTALPPSS